MLIIVARLSSNFFVHIDLLYIVFENKIVITKSFIATWHNRRILQL